MSSLSGDAVWMPHRALVMRVRNWQITESSVSCEESIHSRVLVAAFDRNCQQTCHDSILNSDSEVYKKTLLMQQSNDTD